MILRPAVQKRYVELDEPTLADQRTDLEPAARRDGRPRAAGRPVRAARTLPKVLRATDFKVTAVVVDEPLVDVEPGDTTEVRYAIAFDLGTTTVVATLLDLATGTPSAVSSMLNKQQPFGARRDHPDQRDHAGPAGAAGGCSEAAQETLRRAGRRGVRGGRRRPRSVYEIALAGNATMTELALGIDPEPLGVAPFIMATGDLPGAVRDRPRGPVHPRARAFLFPALGAYVGGDIVAGMLASGHGPRQAAPAVHRRRHQLRDRARRRRPHPAPRPHRRDRPSRAARSGAACAPPTVRSRSSRSPTTCACR